MTWRAFGFSILLGLAWTAAALWAVRPPSPPELRIFVAHSERDDWRVEAHEARVEGFCTVFVRDGLRIAAVCGQHTWSEAREVQ